MPAGTEALPANASNQNGQDGHINAMSQLAPLAGASETSYNMGP